MITAENIKDVNERVKKVEIKGKNYACVAARVAAFREICPNGSITTDIISMDGGVVTMKTTVADENGKILATGMAQEKETSSYINKTSYIENCETSAVGRALGMLGIGSDEQMASAEEVANAITNQNTVRKQVDQKITDKQVIILRSMCLKHKIPEEMIYKQFHREKLEDMTVADWVKFGQTGQEFINRWDQEHENEGNAEKH